MVNVASLMLLFVTVAAVQATSPNWGSGSPMVSVSKISENALVSTGQETSGFTARLSPTGNRLFAAFMRQTAAGFVLSVAVYDQNATKLTFPNVPSTPPFPIFNATTNANDINFMDITVFTDDSFMVTSNAANTAQYKSATYDSASNTWTVQESSYMTLTATTPDYYSVADQTVVSDLLFIPTGKTVGTSRYEGVTLFSWTASSHDLLASRNATYGVTVGDRKPCADVNGSIQYAAGATAAHIWFVCRSCVRADPTKPCAYTFELRSFKRTTASPLVYNMQSPTQTVLLTLSRTLTDVESRNDITEASIFTNDDWLGVSITVPFVANPQSTFATSVFAFAFTGQPNSPLNVQSTVLWNATVSLTSTEATYPPDSFSFGQKTLACRINKDKTALFQYNTATHAFPALSQANRVMMLNPTSSSPDTTSTAVSPVVLQPGSPYAVSYVYDSSPSRNRLLVYSQYACAAGSAFVLLNATQYQFDCVLCSAGTVSTVDQQECSSCGIMQYQSNPGQSACIACPQGFYSPANRTACYGCPPGTKLQPTVGFCEACAGGTFQNQWAQLECKECPAGSYRFETGSANCSSCPAGSYNSNTGQRSCTRCEAGYYQPGQGKTSVLDCLSCAPGNYSPVSGSEMCSPCQQGTYSNLYGLTSCLTCAVGTYQSLTGQSSITACKSCAAGTYSASQGASSCTLCPQGTYSDASESTSCKTCAPGYRSLSSGLASSTACNAPDDTLVSLYQIAIGAFSSLCVAFAGLIFRRYMTGIILFIYKQKLKNAEKECHAFQSQLVIPVAPTESQSPSAASAHGTQKIHATYDSTIEMVETKPSDMFGNYVEASMEIDSKSTDAESPDHAFPVSAEMQLMEEYLNNYRRAVRMLRFQSTAQKMLRAQTPVKSFLVTLCLFIGLFGSIAGIIAFSILLNNEKDYSSSVNS
eukprot:ANDGO_06821.mRNA.1 hypothetical protein